MGKRNEEILRLMKENRVGEKNFNHQGCLMEIIEYNNNRNIIVEFQDEYKVKFCTTYNNFQKGNIKKSILSDGIKCWYPWCQTSFKNQWKKY